MGNGATLFTPDTEQKETGKFNQLEEGKLEMMKILEQLEKSMKLCLDGVLAAVKVQRRSPKVPSCWNCGDLNHIRRNCPNQRDDDCSVCDHVDRHAMQVKGLVTSM